MFLFHKLWISFCFKYYANFDFFVTNRGCYMINIDVESRHKLLITTYIYKLQRLHLDIVYI